MSQLSETVTNVEKADVFECQLIEIKTVQISLLASVVILTKLVNLGLNVKLTQFGNNLAVSSNQVTPVTTLSGNLNVTGLMTVEQNVETVAILIPDVSGLDHSLFFYHGLLVSYNYDLFFTFSIDTTLVSMGSSLVNQFILPLLPTGIYNFVVHWGDGTGNWITTWNDLYKSHTYTTPGVYTVTIAGALNGWAFNGTGDRLKLLTITRWGLNFRLGTNQGGYFDGCANLQILYPFLPNTTGLTSLRAAFRGCSLFNWAPISNLNTLLVTDMSYTFSNCPLFNQSLVSWNMSNATTMAHMFDGASVFNNNGLPLNWYTPVLTDTSFMFSYASVLVVPLNFNMNAVTNCESMFEGAALFNSNSVTLWNMSQVQNMNAMFKSAGEFNVDISGWNVSKVKFMKEMFAYASKFNNGDPPGAFTKPLSWTTTMLTDTSFMFQFADVFNQSLSSFNMSQVTSLESMFNGAVVFNNGGNPNIGLWNVSSVQNMDETFYNAWAFNQGIGGWIVSAVTSMISTFNEARVFNQNLGTWNTANVKNMSYMFKGAVAFNNGQTTTIANVVPKLAYYNNTPVPTLYAPNALFTSGALNVGNTVWIVYNQGIFVTTVAAIPNNTTVELTSAVGVNIVSGDIYNVLFPSVGTNPLSWNTSNNTSFSHMFENAVVFNQNVSGFDVSGINPVTMKNTLDYMFSNAASFNSGDTLSGSSVPLLWNTSNISSMAFTFNKCFAFNQPVGTWVTSEVTTMESMFNQCSRFSQNINTTVTAWNVEKVQTFNNMFFNAVLFKQPINQWKPYLCTTMAGMFSGVDMNNPDSATSQTNYNNLLIAWGTIFMSLKFNVVFDAGLSEYLDSIAGAPRALLANPVFPGKNWTITDGGAFILSRFSFFVKTNNAGVTANNQFQLPLIPTGSYNMTVDWGDMSSTTINAYVFPLPVHTYTTPGTYNIKISGMCEGWRFDGGGDCLKITVIDDFGITFKLGTNEGYYFSGCSNLNITALTAPVLTGTTNLAGTFLGCSSLVYAGMPQWDTAAVTNMESMFSGCVVFNQPLGTWDVTLVQNMTNMFANALSFKQNLNMWTPYACTVMAGMFANVDINDPNSNTNQNNYNALLNSWGLNPSLPLMQNNVVFDAGLSKYLAPVSGAARVNLLNKGWIISDGGAVILGQMSMSVKSDNVGISAANQFTLPLVNAGNYYFGVDWGDTTYNEVYAWNSPNKTHTFTGGPGTYTITLYLYDIFSGWVFNGGGDCLKLLSVGTWDTYFQLGTTQGSYFDGCANLNLTGLNAPNLTGVTPLGTPSTPTTVLSKCFNNCASLTSSSLSSWNVSGVTDLSQMFAGCSTFNVYLGGWTLNTNVMSTVNLKGMFQNASLFNNGQVTTLTGVTPSTASYVENTKTLTCPGATFTTTLLPGDTIWLALVGGDYPGVPTISSFLSTTVASVVDNTNITLTTGIRANIPAGNFFNIQKPTVGANTLAWNTSRVSDMSFLFQNAHLFNQNITNFTSANVTTFESMLDGCILFNNGDLAGGSTVPFNLNTTLANTCKRLLYDCAAFNQPVNYNALMGYWNMSTMTDLSYLFGGCTSFNQYVGDWVLNNNVVDTVNLQGMFFNAFTFNNGQTTTLPSVNPQYATYSGTTSTITCPGAIFSTTLAINDTLLVTVLNMKYKVIVTSIVSNTAITVTNMTIVTTVPDLVSGQILNLEKETAATSPLIAWATSRVINMSYLFNNARLFNQDVRLWDTSNVTTLQNCFAYAVSFNSGDLFANNTKPLLWKTSFVTNMSYLFAYCVAFNQSVSYNSGLGLWVTNNVTSLSGTFLFCMNFNNGQVTTLLNVNPKAVSYNNTTKTVTCLNASFNTTLVAGDQVAIVSRGSGLVISTVSGSITPTSFVLSSDLGYSLDTGQVFNVVKLSQSTGSLPLNWDAPANTSLNSTFAYCSVFNQNINSFDSGNVVTMENLLNRSYCFNNGDVLSNNTVPLNLKTGKVGLDLTGNMNSMFLSAFSFNQTIQYNAVQGYWDTQNVVSMKYMFHQSQLFNNGQNNSMFPTALVSLASYTASTKVISWPGANFTSGDVGKTLYLVVVPNSYVGTIASFTNSSTVTMSSLSFGLTAASDFVAGTILALQSTNTGTIPLTLNTSKVTDMNNMFSRCYLFNQSLGTFATNEVTIMTSMFQRAFLFNQTITTWNTSKVTDMSTMFDRCSLFNSPINYNAVNQYWNTSMVKNMSAMFRASTFNQPLGLWITDTVTNMSGMFNANQIFNQNIGSWNVSNVETMDLMFKSATQFNNSDSINSGLYPITWTAPKCTTFSEMFSNTTAFNQALPYLVNTSGLGVTTASLSSMFESALSFNNGAVSTLDTVTPALASYNGSTKVLSCPNAYFATGIASAVLAANQVITVTTTTTSFTALISAFTTNTITLNNSSLVGSSTTFNAGTIVNVESKSIKGIYLSGAPTYSNSPTPTITVASASLLTYNQLYPGVTIFIFTTTGVYQRVVASLTNTTIVLSTGIGASPGTLTNIQSATSNNTVPLTSATANTATYTSASKTLSCPSATFITTGQVQVGTRVSIVTASTMYYGVVFSFTETLIVFTNDVVGSDLTVTTIVNLLFESPTNNTVQLVSATAATASYSSASKTLTCPGATFVTSAQVSNGKSVWVLTKTNTYVGVISSFTSTTVVFTNDIVGSDVSSPNIHTLLFQLPTTRTMALLTATASTASYQDVTKTLTCPLALFVTTNQVKSGNKVLIALGATIYTGIISTFTETTIIFSNSLGLSISTPNITNLSYQAENTTNTSLLWKTENISSLANCFASTRMFNQNLSFTGPYWNSNMWTSLDKTFFTSLAFQNGDVQQGNIPLNWTVSNVTLFSSCFQDCRVFNQNIFSWNVSNATTMFSMFAASNTITAPNRFNNGDGASGQQALGVFPLSTWTAPKCSNFSYMFYNATVFNQSLSNLLSTSVASVTSIDCNLMFYRAYSFNNGQFNTLLNVNPATASVSSATLTCPNTLFWGNVNFTAAISGKRVYIVSSTNVFSVIVSFSTATSLSLNAFLPTISAPNIQNVLLETSAYGTSPLSWDTSKVTNMTSMFDSCRLFNQNVANMNLSNVLSLSNMFYSASSYNNGNAFNMGTATLSTWKAPKCTDFSYMFSSAQSFNQPVPYLVDTSTLVGSTTLSNMFSTGLLFNNGYITTLPGCAPNVSTYSSGKLLNCQGGFLAYPFVVTGSVLVVTASATTFTGVVPSSFTLTSITLLSTYATAITVSNVLNITNSTLYSVNPALCSYSGATLTCPQSTFVTTGQLFAGQNIYVTTTANVNYKFTVVSFTETSIVVLENLGVTLGVGTLSNIQLAPNSNTVTLTSSTPATSTFNSASKTLTCPGASFVASNQVSAGKVVWIKTANDTFVGTVASFTNTTIVFTEDVVGLDLLANSITSLLLQTAMSYLPLVTATYSTSSYDNTTAKLTCPGALFISAGQIQANNKVWIVVSVSTTYVGVVSSFTETTITFTSALGVTLNAGNIVGLLYQSPTPNTSLFWKTENVFSLASLFNSSRLFNTNISTDGPYWKNTSWENLSSCFSNTWSFQNGDMYIGTNQPLLWTTPAVTDMSAMFLSARLFNQSVVSFSLLNVSNLNSMFFNALLFNNGDLTTSSTKPLNTWTAPLCTDYSNMFSATTSFLPVFNQSVSRLVDTSALPTANVTLDSMFANAVTFNNGLSTSIPSLTPSIIATASYSSRIITCTGSNFVAPYVNIGNYIMILNTTTYVFRGIVLNFNATSITFTTDAPSTTISSGLIYNIVNTTVYGMVNASTTYDNSNVTFTCPGATFLTTNQLFVGSTIHITTSTGFYTRTIVGLTETTIQVNTQLGASPGTIQNIELAPSDFTIQLWTATASTSSYSSLNRTLTCPSASFTTSGQLVSGFEVYIKTAFNSYKGVVQSITDTSIVFTSDIVGTDIMASNIVALFLKNTSLQWKTEQVITMRSLFGGAGSTTGTRLFNQNIAERGLYWKTNAVTNLDLCFLNALSFQNGDVFTGGNIPLKWNTTSVVGAQQTFRGAVIFNQNVNKWSLQSIASGLANMFLSAYLFNNGDTTNAGTKPLNNWTCVNSGSYASMFGSSGLNTLFNQRLPTLVQNVSTSTICTSMFSGNTKFNNGQITTIPTVNISLVSTSYSAPNLTVNCPSATVTPYLRVGNIVSIVTSSAAFTGTVYEITNDQTFKMNNNSSQVASTSAGNVASLVNTTITGMTNSTTTHDNNVTITCPGATFTTTAELLVNDVLYINTATTKYERSIVSFTNDTITVNSPLGAIGAILNIQKIFRNAWNVNVGTIDLIQVSYNQSNNTLTCPGALLETVGQVLPGDIVLFTTTTQAYSGTIATLGVTDTTLVFTSDVVGSNIAPTNITSVKVKTTYEMNWITNKVSSFNLAFTPSSFNQYVSQNGSYWTMEGTVNLSFMFFNNYSFNNGDVFEGGNQSLSWGSLCTPSDLSYCFNNTRVFNQTISQWNVSSVTTFLNFLNSNSRFNNGDVTNVKSKSLSSWSAPLCTTFYSMFFNCALFNQDLTNLVNSTSLDTSLEYMLYGCSSFNGRVSNWVVSRVISLSNTFNGCSAFNNGDAVGVKSSPLTWQASKCASFYYTFNNCSSLDQNMSTLVNLPSTGTVFASCESMFGNCTRFNGNVSDWQIYKVNSFTNTFSNCTLFNNGDLPGLNNFPLTKWGIGTASSCYTTFNACSSFNQSISSLLQIAVVINIPGFLGACPNFNNGDFGATAITGDVTNSTYSDSTRSLFVSGGSFTTEFVVGDTVVLYAFDGTYTGFYQSRVQSITNNVFLTLRTSLGTSFGAGNIKGIRRQPILGGKSILSGTPSTAAYTTSNRTLSMPGGSFFAELAVNNVVYFSTIDGNLQTLRVESITSATQVVLTPAIGSNYGAGTITSVYKFVSGACVGLSGSPASATYTASTSTITNLSASYFFELAANDVIVVRTTTGIKLPTKVVSRTDTTIVVATSISLVDLSAGVITSIVKQLPGSRPLLWYTSTITGTTSAGGLGGLFSSSNSFNQSLTSQAGGIWNLSSCKYFENCFRSISTTDVHLFNNGQISTGTTAPLNWVVAAGPVATNWRTNCVLTTGNYVTTPQLP